MYGIEVRNGGEGVVIWDAKKDPACGPGSVTVVESKMS